MSGILYVVGTPIGNLDDLSPRAARILASADVIACEDTRIARALLSRVPTEGKHRARLVACHARNERVRTPEIVREIAAGACVALTTDAGMPGLSDPGQRLVAACADAGLRVEIVPGPSAVPSALILSGLPVARFVFEGFLPRTGSARRRRLEALKDEERAIVLFEAPHRVAASLSDAAEVLGARRAAIARELTKIHEEVLRGTLVELTERAQNEPIRGEITIVIEGAPPREVQIDPAGLSEQVDAAVARGVSRKEAIAAVAAATKVPKRAVYKAVVDRRARNED